MNGSLDARIEVARGELHIGALVVPMTPDGATGAWRLGGTAGPLLRALRYGERTRLSALAATSQDPRASLAAAVARASTVADGHVGDAVREVAALLLSGAATPGAPFDEVVLRVGRAGGWDLAQILDAPGDEVDRLARALRDPQAQHARVPEAGASQVRPKTDSTSGPGDGWNRLVFDDGTGPASVTAIRDMLADHLLARVEPTGAMAQPVDALSDDSATAGPPPGTDVAPAADRGARVSARWVAQASRQVVPASAAIERVRLEAAPTTPGESQPAVATPAPASAGGSLLAASAAASAGSPTHDRRLIEEPTAENAGPQPSWSATHSWVPAPAGAVQVHPAARAANAADARGPAIGRRAPAPDRLGLGAVAASRSSLALSERPSLSWASGSLRATPASHAGQTTTATPTIDALAPDVADALAVLLQDEADLRGVE